MFSSSAKGLYQANEKQVLMRPHSHHNGKGVIFLHGAGGTALQGRYDAALPKTNALVRAIVVEYGYPVLSIDAGGTATWGNDASRTAIGNAITWFRANEDIETKIHLLGVSMGGLVALNFGLFAPDDVERVAAIVPALDPNYIVVNNPNGGAASVNTAYNTYNDATMRATKNPSWYVPNVGLDVPARIWYATDDIYTPDATSAAVAAVLGGVSVGGLGHTDAAVGVINPMELAQYFEAA